jgi:putative heme transporter
VSVQRETLTVPPRRRLALVAVVAVAAIGGLYVLLPALAGLEDTWERIGRGDGWLLTAAAALECLSFLSYVVAFRGVFAGGVIRIDWTASYRITMAGVAATRLLATAGAGGIVLTVWALDRLGMARREIAAREATFLVLLYGLFMATLVIGGIGLRTGVLPGPAPFGLTVVPAIFGGTVIAVSLAAAAFSRDVDSAADRFEAADSHGSRIARALATVPATLATGVRGALTLIREGRVEALGAAGWWAFDIAVLAACLHAFGGDPPVSVVVMAYFVGMLANTLPVPGGIGAVDGGMIGALIGFGVDAGLAIVAVLSYRLFAFWLPIVPGVLAYVQLLRAPPARAGSEVPG